MPGSLIVEERGTKFDQVSLFLLLSLAVLISLTLSNQIDFFFVGRALFGQ